MVPNCRTISCTWDSGGEERSSGCGGWVQHVGIEESVVECCVMEETHMKLKRKIGSVDQGITSYMCF